jgi:probable HAF family extracellular repeat protein
MTRKLQTPLIFAFVLLAVANSARGAKFVPLGGTSFDPYGLSANGSVVVGSRFLPSVGTESARWTSSGGVVGLGDLPSGITSSLGFGVSSDGNTVVGYGNTSSGLEAYRWTPGSGMIGLGDLPGGASSSSANDVSEDGSIVVGTGSSVSGPLEAFRWTQASGMIALGDLPGGIFQSEANAVSADGSVIVGEGYSASGFEAFVWTSSGGMTGLGDLPGGAFQSSARGVSADGTTIVGRGAAAAGNEAFRWTQSGGMVGLGDLPGGAYEGEAIDASANGAVIVGDSNSAVGQEAFVWDAANGMRKISDVLAPSVGAAISGWTLSYAAAVSDDGRTVIGFGSNPASGYQGWIAYLADQVFWYPQTGGSWDDPNSWSGPFLPSASDDVVVNPAATVTVSGPYYGSVRTVKSLTVGGAGPERVTLQLTGQLRATASATFSTGAELALLGGTFTTPVLANSGVISGGGTLAANLSNAAAGQLRISSGQTMLLDGTSHVNAGKIEANGGAFEVVGSLVNSASTGLITGQSASLRFSSGLVNNGALALPAGLNNVSGDVTNNAGATITVTGGADAVFYDDVVQNGTLRVAKVGATASTAVFLGSFTGSGGSTGGGDVFFEGDLRPGNSPALVTFANNVSLGDGAVTQIELAGTTVGSQYDKINVTGALALDGDLRVSLLGGFAPAAGNAFDVLDWGSLGGTFDSVSLPALAPSLAWNATQLYATGVLKVGYAGDFDFDGDVDGADLLVWQRGGSPTPGSPGDLAAWKATFGLVAAVAAGGASSAAVPEPASLPLAVGALVFNLRRRPRQRFAP